MKYGKQLSQNAIPEWQHFYINYRALKSSLKVVKSHMSPEGVELNPINEIRIPEREEDGRLPFLTSFCY